MSKQIAPWRPKLTAQLQLESETLGTPNILNLASAEYGDVALHGRPDNDVISCAFLERKGGALRSVSAYAKAARGAMARFVLTHNIKDARELEGFSGLGYRFDQELSSPEKKVFTRTLAHDHPQKQSALRAVHVDLVGHSLLHIRAKRKDQPFISIHGFSLLRPRRALCQQLVQRRSLKRRRRILKSGFEATLAGEATMTAAEADALVRSEMMKLKEAQGQAIKQEGEAFWPKTAAKKASTRPKRAFSTSTL